MNQKFELKQHPILSIIVPVYNVEKYLRECLDSLVNQDVSADCYEIICIDDGSPDNCGTILDEYNKNYHNMYVIHQDNIGLAGARNAGLAIAKGDYIWFVDSDDFISTHAVEIVCNAINSQHSDVFWFGALHFYEDSVKLDNCNLYLYESNMKLRTCYSWKTIRRAQFLKENSLFFLDETVTSLAEDYLIHFKVMKCNPKEGVVTEKPLYFYRYVSSSISNTLSQESIEKRVYVWLYVIHVQRDYFIKENGKERVNTALEMQDCIKGIFHWLSLLETKTADCFTNTFNKDYLPYVFSLSLRCIFLDIRAFLYRRIVNSYNQKHKYLFRVYNFCRESNLMKKSKKKIKKIIRR